MTEWAVLCRENLDAVPEAICNELGIDCELTGFAGEEWQVSLPDAGFILCLRNLVLHCVQIGFTNAEIDEAIQLTCEVYHRLVTHNDQFAVISDLELFIDAIRKFSYSFSSVKLTQLVEYLQSDILQHVNLYKFCAFGQRTSAARSAELVVDTMSCEKILPLKSSLRKDICEYEIKLKSIEANELAEKAKLSEESAAKAASAEQQAKEFIHSKMEEWLALDSPQFKDVVDMIDSVVRKHLWTVSSRASGFVENMEVDLKYKLDKTALPRPAKLGPPPRFKLKPAIQVPKSDLPGGPMSTGKIPSAKQTNK